MVIEKYIVASALTLLTAAISASIVRKIAIRSNIVDKPEIDADRKIHKKPIPLLGGLALFTAIAVSVAYFSLIDNQLLGGYLLSKHLIGLMAGGLVIMFGGYLDDRYHLKPSRQIIFPLLASLIIIASGISIDYVSNPFGESFNLNNWETTLFTFQGLPYTLTLVADIFVVFWLMGMMYTTKFLDGLDGLATGVTTIGSFIIFFLSLTFEVGQPETALLALIFGCAGLGFLIFNFHPAKIFLGEGGSVFVGYMLGVLAIISGAKVATALLIMGIPILDVVWVIIRRLFVERKSPTSGDKKHLHFRLLDIGLSHRQSVVFLYILTAAFGLASLFFTGRAKIYTLVLLAFVMIILAFLLVLIYKKKNRGQTS